MCFNPLSDATFCRWDQGYGGTGRLCPAPPFTYLRPQTDGGELSVLPRRRGRWLQGCLHCLLSNGYYLVVHLGGVQIYWERMKNEVNLNFLALNLTGNIEYVCFRNLFPAINLVSSTNHKPRQGGPTTCE